MERPETSLDKSLLDTVANSDLRDVATDTTEILLDAFMTEGVLKEIPIIRTIAGLANAGITIKDRLFAEKVIRFLQPLSKYSDEARRKLLESLDPAELRKASQYMILYLDRLDSLEKPWMLGKIFEAYMLKKISYQQMLYFTHFVDSVFILVWQAYHTAIKEWCDAPANEIPNIATDDALALEKVGFYEERHKPIKGTDRRFEQTLMGVKRKLVLTDAGWDFIRTVFQLCMDSGPPAKRYRSSLSVDLK